MRIVLLKIKKILINNVLFSHEIIKKRMAKK